MYSNIVIYYHQLLSQLTIAHQTGTLNIDNIPISNLKTSTPLAAGDTEAIAALDTGQYEAFKQIHLILLKRTLWKTFAPSLENKIHHIH